jgi:hypothetical protein
VGVVLCHDCEVIRQKVRRDAQAKTMGQVWFHTKSSDISVQRNQKIAEFLGILMEELFKWSPRVKQPK